jgi:hypothetical protein
MINFLYKEYDSSYMYCKEFYAFVSGAVFTKMARTASTCINPNLYAVSKINTLEIQKNQSNRTKVARKPLCLQSDKNLDDRPIT